MKGKISSFLLGIFLILEIAFAKRERYIVLLINYNLKIYFNLFHDISK